jgi:hypothetical protein
MGYEDDMQRLEHVFDTYALVLRKVYSMEKIHGSSAFIEYKDGKLNYHAGCLPSVEFAKLFDEKRLCHVIKTKQLGALRRKNSRHEKSIRRQNSFCCI